MSDDVFKKFEGYHTIGAARERLLSMGANEPIPTIRNWSNDLHQLQVHTLPRNQRGERIYSEIDIQILLFIHEAKKRFGKNMTMDAISTMIQSDERFSKHLNYDPTDGGQTDPGTGLIASEHRIKEIIRSELEELNLVKEQMLRAQEELKSAKENYENQRLLLPDPAEEKRQRNIEIRTMLFDQLTTQKKIERRLADRAAKEWALNPKKKGFIFKSEDIEAKTTFIKEYVDSHFDEELKKEYEENNG
ncbi:hypothetical protein [Cohnella soli]|uniref:MerR family transcriptional regulator n=1 Tax=Cohnella soli TaxID=425005 RepID=A0ABW0HQF8_9BACL